MTTMTSALKIAGVPLPTVKYRIWNWLRDHPEKTCQDIGVALGLGYNPAQAMSEMEKGGVVKAYSDVSRKPGLNGMELRVKRYSVVNAAEYETSPNQYTLNKAKKQAAKALQTARQATPTTTTPKASPPPKTTPKAPAEFNAEAHANSLTLPQARAVYDFLKGVFA